MFILGFNILGHLNKDATSVENLGLALWRLVIASGILSSVMGVVNIVAVSCLFPSAISRSWHCNRLMCSVIPSLVLLAVKFEVMAQQAPKRMPSQAIASQVVPFVGYPHRLYHRITLLQLQQSDTSPVLASSFLFACPVFQSLLQSIALSSRNGRQEALLYSRKFRDHLLRCIPHTIMERRLHTQHPQDIALQAM